ncbi:kinase-like domain-containing protein [Coprinopsis sp. MPI-PUGE-AT-0042]|nr:kinase-like domain-containing protein [Coprinopsis sp. MPI-PUGE-AT-0042]
MNVKVVDFRLAALIENPGERKKTICVTPNHIAAEMLFDTANSYSFEVDIWSIRVILFTLVVGRPPFQTKEVKDIYKRIRDNEYEFPIERPIISAARTSLVQGILEPDPSQRPALHDIVDVQSFTQAQFQPSSPPPHTTHPQTSVTSLAAQATATFDA